MLKVLLLYLDAEKGRSAGDAWLRTIRTVRSDIEDETHPIPRSTLHAGLRSFVDTTSRSAVMASARYFLAKECCGFWSRVLRGASTPCDAYAKLDGMHGEYGRTMRWEILEAHDGVWRGKVHLRHDPDVEKDGLLSLSRASMISAIPALFGYEIAHVVVKAALASSDEPGEVVQELESRWRSPRALRGIVGGAIAGAGVAALGDLVGHPVFSRALTFGVVGAIGGASGGAIAHRESLRRIQSGGQAVRVRVLERNLALQEARSRAATGEVVGSIVAGEYRIMKAMGAGASGVIYEARRVRDDLPVAIKLLRAAAAHESVASDRLRREAEALGLAWHPNVVEVIDHGHLPDGTAYLVMELLAGESLATRLKQRKKLSPKELLPIARDVCDALAAVHAAGVIHRDIKPGNIFMERTTDDLGNTSERVKLLDFGIARIEWEETRITTVGSPVGTPGYMSPEQETGIEVDARSDIYSFGAALYECLVGEPPPPTPSGLWLVASENPSAGANRDTQIRSALGEAPPAWRAIVERALMPNPDDRYPDARAFAKALRDLDAPAQVAVR